MKHITHTHELEVGRSYWLVAKFLKHTKIGVCHEINGVPYFDDQVWAMTDMRHGSAFHQWDIYGPIPIPTDDAFEAMKTAKIAELKAS